MKLQEIQHFTDAWAEAQRCLRNTGRSTGRFCGVCRCLGQAVWMVGGQPPNWRRGELGPHMAPEQSPRSLNQCSWTRSEAPTHRNQDAKSCLWKNIICKTRGSGTLDSFLVQQPLKLLDILARDQEAEPSRIQDESEKMRNSALNTVRGKMSEMGRDHPLLYSVLIHKMSALYLSFKHHSQLCYGNSNSRNSWLADRLICLFWKVKKGD